MKYMINNIVSVTLTCLIYVLGGFDIALKSLLIIIVIDYITGILSAIYNKELSSTTGFKGIIKKFTYLLIVALSVVVDKLTNQNGVIRTLVIYFLVANDGLSIIENINEMGIKLPSILTKYLEDLRKDN